MSTVLGVYDLISQKDMGKLHRDVSVPGLLAMLMYMATIAVICRVRHYFLPTVPKATWAERIAGLRDVWAPIVLFVLVIGGLYGGVFTPTEAGGVGASGAFLLGILRRRLDRAGIRASLLQATRPPAAGFPVLIGALLFGYFLPITPGPQKVTEFLTGLGLDASAVLAIIIPMYLLLRCP